MGPPVRLLRGQLFDTVAFTATVIALALAVVVPVVVLAGGGLRAVQSGLFVASMPVLGGALLLLRPESLQDYLTDDEEGDAAGDGTGGGDEPPIPTRDRRTDRAADRVEAALTRVEPVPAEWWYPEDEVVRPPPGLRLLVAGGVLFAVPFLIDAAAV